MAPARHAEPPAEVSPDQAAESLGAIDNIVPTRGYSMLPVVALGGSAGAIPALERFFSALPAHTGLAYVVILHLSPDFNSELAAVLQRCTSMRVMTAIDGIKVAPDCVFIIPPGKHLVSADGHLNLTELAPQRGRRVAVDLFFRTLADTHGPHCAAIVLSGADSDGAIGIKRIKERGGLTIAQDPAEAEHSSMPRAAVATGMVDWILAVDEMPARIVEYYSRARRVQLPAEEGDRPVPGTATPPADDDSALRELLIFLRTRTGRDFSYYKRATTLRRISRRMQVNGMETLPDYLAYVRTHPGECTALLQDLLISVTNFFRDRECFAALEKRIPELFAGKGPDRVVRVWVPGCATGEEAYSIAILLIEHARTFDRPPALQVFASDLDEDVLQLARTGLYPETIAADVSEERLKLFFIKEVGGYRIRRELRETTLFALHDLLKDSPFSRLDLVSCRNLLIYLNREAQRRALGIFHFALLPTGRLFLGSSESIEEAAQLFAALDPRERLYAPREGIRTPIPVPVGPNILLRAQELRMAARERPALPAALLGPPADSNLALTSPPGLAGEIHARLLEQLGPPSILVNEQHEIVNLTAAAAKFLQFSGGEPSRDLLRTIAPALRIPLRAALFQAQQSGLPTQVPRQAVATADGPRRMDLRITPAKALCPGYLLVMLEILEDDPPGAAGGSKEASGSGPASVVETLERENEQLKRQLRSVIEEGESSTEELKSSNEELQAVNEELRSATEELETSREELQSINEELTTVNQELKLKVEELARANSDLHNLMASTAIPIIFLDRQLRIMRFTPAAVEIFNLIEADEGRPLADITGKLDQPTLMHDAGGVLRSSERVQNEVTSQAGLCYLATIHPYRSADHRIEGVVLTYVDITRQKQADQAVRQAKAELEERVASRTAELHRVNAALRAEMAERERAEAGRQAMARHLMSAQEDERARISKGLHDQIGQQLTALSLGLKALKVGATSEDRLPSLTAIVEEIAKEVHGLALALRPAALDDLGLERTVSNYLAEWSQRTGIAADFHANGLKDRRLPATIETTFYRIICEALNNVLKHAGARHVSVIITRGEQDATAIIEDDGSGFSVEKNPPRSAPRKLGIVGMRERAALLGGEVTVETTSGRGTTLFVRLPLIAPLSHHG